MLCIYSSVLDELWRRGDADLCWGAKSLWFHALTSFLSRVLIGGSCSFLLCVWSVFSLVRAFGVIPMLCECGTWVLSPQIGLRWRSIIIVVYICSWVIC